MKIFTSKRIGAILLIAAASGATGYVASAQTGASGVLPSNDIWMNELHVERLRLSVYGSSATDGGMKNYEAAKSQAGALMRAAVGNKARTGYLAQEWGASESSDAIGFTALQNQKMIEQNEQIIALLKAKK